MEELQKIYERVIAEGEHLPAEEPQKYITGRVYSLGELETKISEIKSQFEKEGLWVLEEEGKVYFAMKTGCMGCPGIGSCFDDYFQERGTSAVKGKEVVLFGLGTGCGDSKALDDMVKLGDAGKIEKKFPIWRFYNGCSKTIDLLMARFKYMLEAKSVTYIYATEDFPGLGDFPVLGKI